MTAPRHEYLLEVGCEELPAGFLQTVEAELRDRLEKALAEARLAYRGFDIYLTPRRIAFCIHELEGQQPASEEWVKGPPVKVGLDADGKYTQAAEGFCRKQGLQSSDLTVKEIDGEQYLSFLKQDNGRSVTDLFPEILPDVILSLPGSHFMRWDVTQDASEAIAFSRPIRWVVSLLDGAHLPLHFGPLVSGVTSQGHRFMAPSRAVTIQSPQSYLTQLEQEGFVLADHHARRERIQDVLTALAAKENLIIPEQADLLDHVTMLVEYPSPVLGQFDDAYLRLPDPVITTVMTAHQKYFHALTAQKTLLPGFVTIANNALPAAETTIREGNQKVLKARLEDASFFFAEDTKRPFGDFVAALSGITFQKNLGSLLDKTHRLKALMPLVQDLAQADAAVLSDAVRAAELSKADLATLMVRELTELQGTVGMHYARQSQENEAVSVAIDEHYLPRYAGDAIPSSVVGTLLSLADKVDTLVAAFAQKDMKPPTGSRDPMGLRRLCVGLIATVLGQSLSFDFTQAVAKAYELLGPLATAPYDDCVSQLNAFFLQRLRGAFLDEGYRYDLIDAVFAADSPVMSDLVSAKNRLDVLKNHLGDTDALKAIYEPANRVAKILGAQYDASAELTAVDAALLENDAERDLCTALQGAQETLLSASDDACFKALAALGPVVAMFFEKTLVNAEDARVKANRYLVLSVLNRGYRRLADWTKLVVS